MINNMFTMTLFYIEYFVLIFRCLSANQRLEHRLGLSISPSPLDIL